MKHNQFKAILNKMLKDKCKQYGMKMSSVDITNNEKLIYVFDNEWNCTLSIRLYVTDKQMHISGSTDISKEAGIGNRPFDVTCSYLRFNKICKLLDDMFNSISEG